MTPPLVARVFYPAQLFDIAEIDAVINNELNATAKAVKVDLNAITRTWKHRPGFSVEVGVYSRLVHAYRAEKAGRVFEMLDAGTEPHEIRARNVPRLRFYAKGFQPKTFTRQLYSGPGRAADQNLRFPVSVHHPGTEAREWYDTVSEKWRKELPIQFQRSIDAAFNRMMKKKSKVVTV